MEQTKAKIDKKGLIDAILSRDINKIMFLSGKLEPKLYQFYTSEKNVYLNEDTEQIFQDPKGVYFDSEGNETTLLSINSISDEMLKKAEKFKVTPGLVCLQLVENESLNEKVLKLKEDARTRDKT